MEGIGFTADQSALQDDLSILICHHCHWCIHGYACAVDPFAAAQCKFRTGKACHTIDTVFLNRQKCPVIIKVMAVGF